MAAVKTLDIQFDKASKFYEPLERVTGTVIINGFTSVFEHAQV
jgi:hypothetical protein